MIARFVCLLPFPLSLKLVSNKHFHTIKVEFKLGDPSLPNINIKVLGEN